MTDTSPAFNAVAEILSLLDTAETQKGSAAKRDILRNALLKTAKLTEEFGKAVGPEYRGPNMNFKLDEQDSWINANLRDISRPDASFIRYSEFLVREKLKDVRKYLALVGTPSKFHPIVTQAEEDWSNAGLAAGALGLAEMHQTEVIFGKTGKRPLVAGAQPLKLSIQ